MANVNIKFNNKDYLLSCDDGQEESLKNLTKYLDKKYSELKDKLGNIGENKLLLITTIHLIDEYFDLKKRVTEQKLRLDNLSSKFQEMRELAIKYKDSKDKEIQILNDEINKFKVTIEESNSLYESMLDRTTKSLEKILLNTESISKIQWMKKDQLRKKFYRIRKKQYFDINSKFFTPLIKLIKKKFKNKINLSIYYPMSYEVNTLKLLELNTKDKIRFFLPVIKGNNSMYFHNWQKDDLLQINKLGILEPMILNSHKVPDVMLIPMLAFDKDKNRLGYGGGFYDRYLNKFLKKNKNIITVGIAFSFQNYHKIPISDEDVKLDYILTERGYI